MARAADRPPGGGAQEQPHGQGPHGVWQEERVPVQLQHNLKVRGSRVGGGAYRQGLHGVWIEERVPVQLQHNLKVNGSWV